MAIVQLQILLDLNYGNETTILDKHASLTDYGNWLFVDSEDGHCYLFDKNGKIDDIKKMKKLIDVKKDIKKILIPNGVKSIGEWAFYDCTLLKNIEILESVESIGYEAFAKCTSLTSIKIPESVKSIGDWAFNNCASLKSIKISKSIESIGYGIFTRCTSLEEVIFEGKTMDQVKAMDNYPWRIKNESIIKCS